MRGRWVSTVGFRDFVNFRSGLLAVQTVPYRRGSARSLGGLGGPNQQGAGPSLKKAGKPLQCFPIELQGDGQLFRMSLEHAQQQSVGRAASRDRCSQRGRSAIGHFPNVLLQGRTLDCLPLVLLLSRFSVRVAWDRSFAEAASVCLAWGRAWGSSDT